VMSEYMHLYKQLMDEETLLQVGNAGDPTPRNRTPSPTDWAALTKSEQFGFLKKTAEQTLPRFETLAKNLGGLHNIDFKVGPVKNRDRALEKVDRDYGGDVLKLLDMIRCSAVCPMHNLADAKAIVESFKEGGSMCGQGWDFVRCKDAFGSLDDFLTGGYRDIKLNLRCRKTGLIVEVQLHLKRFYDVKGLDGYTHFANSRKVKVDGLGTTADVVAGLPIALTQEMLDVGEQRLAWARSAEAPPGALIRTLRTNAELQHAHQRNQQAATLFEEAHELLTGAHDAASGGRFTGRQVDYAGMLLVMIGRCLVELRRSDAGAGGDKWAGKGGLKCAEEGIEELTRRLGASHPVTLRARAMYAYLLGLSGKIAEADKEYQDVLDAQARVLGMTHPDIVETLQSYGNFASDAETNNADLLHTGVRAYETALAGSVSRAGFIHPRSILLLETLMELCDRHCDVLKDGEKRCAKYHRLLEEVDVAISAEYGTAHQFPAVDMEELWCSAAVQFPAVATAVGIPVKSADGVPVRGPQCVPAY